MMLIQRPLNLTNARITIEGEDPTGRVLTLRGHIVCDDPASVAILEELPHAEHLGFGMVVQDTEPTFGLRVLGRFLRQEDGKLYVLEAQEALPIRRVTRNDDGTWSPA